MIRKMLDRIVPFIFLGMALVALVAGFVLFSYLLIFGALVGFVLFVILRIKEKFFPDKNKTTQYHEPTRTGRIIEHDDKK